ncbi:MAG: response regulator, partial [Cytophagales bacterium]
MAYHILWADDEIDLLKPHVIFLQNKGFEVSTVFNGNDALDFCLTNTIDLLFLDENMPGLSGLETLEKVKQIKPNLPVVMITKSDEERISEQAIGSQISDYLLKPLNPNQILISVKKILDNKRLVSEKTKMDYQQEFRNISYQISESSSINEWIEIYKKLVYWEQQLENSGETNLKEILVSQKEEANQSFASFVSKNYESWLNDPKSDKPILSHQVLRKKVFPQIDPGKNTFLILIDNLRFDQWVAIAPMIGQYFKIEEESIYSAILPTTTAYARNSFFAGMMPSDIAKVYPDLWVNDDDGEGQNKYEEQLLLGNLKKNKLDLKCSYHKVIHQH